MHVAVTGTHGIGKTTLVEDLAESAEQFEPVPEPYIFCQSETAFVDGPNTEDLEEQLNQSCELILGAASRSNLVFDRCPIDFLAYLDVLSEAEGSEWMPSPKQFARIERAMEALDLVVFIPLLDDDEIAVEIKYPRLRRQVDLRLKAMLRDPEFDLVDNGPPLLEIFGQPQQRVARVLEKLPMRDGWRDVADGQRRS